MFSLFGNTLWDKVLKCVEISKWLQHSEVYVETRPKMRALLWAVKTSFIFSKRDDLYTTAKSPRPNLHGSCSCSNLRLLPAEGSTKYILHFFEKRKMRCEMSSGLASSWRFYRLVEDLQNGITFVLSPDKWKRSISHTDFQFKLLRVWGINEIKLGGLVHREVYTGRSTAPNESHNNKSAVWYVPQEYFSGQVIYLFQRSYLSDHWFGRLTWKFL